MAAISGKSDTFESDLLLLIFNATAIANIADNAATSPLTNLFVALHTADPLEAGDQTASEATYTGYARVAVARLPLHTAYRFMLRSLVTQARRRSMWMQVRFQHREIPR